MHAASHPTHQPLQLFAIASPESWLQVMPGYMQTKWLFTGEEYDPTYGHMPEWIPRPWADCTKDISIGMSPFPRLNAGTACEHHIWWYSQKLSSDAMA